MAKNGEMLGHTVGSRQIGPRHLGKKPKRQAQPFIKCLNRVLENRNSSPHYVLRTHNHPFAVTNQNYTKAKIPKLKIWLKITLVFST